MTSGPSDAGPPDAEPPPGGWGQPAHPPPPDEAPPEKRSGWAVAGGVLLGLVLGFYGLPTATVLLVGPLGTLTGVDWLGVVGFLVPFVVGIALLVPRKLRFVGAGIIMGLAIGMIVGAAACLGLLGIVIVSYGSGVA